MCILCAPAVTAAATGVWQIPLAAAREASHAASATPHIVCNFVRPVLFAIGAIKIYNYGMMVASALLTATWVFEKEMKKASIDLEVVHCFFVFLAGFGIGSKSHLALSAFGAGEPLTWKAFDIRTGHSFMGSQIGAVGFMLIFIKIKKVPVMKLLDALLPCCLLGHVIGKGGCFLSGDGCYGPPADPKDVPWAMSFPNAADPTMIPVHPTPIYEAVLSFAVFSIALLAFPMPRPAGTDGRRTAVVLILYGIERVCIEPFRRHPPIQFFMGLTEYQALAVVLLFVGAAIELSISAGEAKAIKSDEQGSAPSGGGKKTKQQKKKE